MSGGVVHREWVTAAPAPPLRPYIARYAGYRYEGGPPGLHRGLPSRHLTFIVGIGDPIDVIAQTDPRQAPARYRCVLSGLQARPALIADPGHGEGVAVELSPLGARALLGLPAAAIWDTSLELADVVGPAGDELWERLQPAASWAERFAVCDRALGALLGAGEPDPHVEAAWRRLEATHGAAPVEALARAVGWSRQHLTRRFTRELGLGPTPAGRVMRFERARRLLEGPTAPPIAEVAARCGYSDQAHLTREFGALAGCPPARLLAERVPDVQDRRAAAAPA